MTVKHLSTKCNGNEIGESKIFEQLRCFLNFSNDMIEFGFKVKPQQWQKIDIGSQTISYEVIKTPNYRKQMKELPLVTNKASDDKDCYINVSLLSSIKETLLGLFSPHKKEFQLRIVWSVDKRKYEALYFALIPGIEQK